MNDFDLDPQGTIILLAPQTDAAREWVDEHLPADVQTWGDSIVVEHRYIDDIVDGIRNDGLTLSVWGEAQVATQEVRS